MPALCVSRRVDVATLSGDPVKLEVWAFPQEDDAVKRIHEKEALEKLGVKTLNSGIMGQVHRDRFLLTGDSPLASKNLGKLAAETLPEDLSIWS